MADYQGRNADQVVEAMMDHLRQGDPAAAEEALRRVEFLSHYGTGSPSWKGMHNLGHMIRTLLTSHAMNTKPGERQLHLANPIR